MEHAYSDHSAQHEQYYNDIMALYDTAESLVDTVSRTSTPDRASQLLLIEPIIEDIQESADELTESFIFVVTSDEQKKKTRKISIESSLRRLFMAVDNFCYRLEEMATDSGKMLRNAAIPLIERLRRQAEHIVAIFLNFVDLSVDRIMHAWEVEEMKRREQLVASQLHNMSRS